MSELLLTLLRLGFLVLLWVLVLSVIGVLRTDIYGTRLINRAGTGRSRRSARAGGSEGATAPGADTTAQSQARPTSPPRETPAAPTRLLITEGSGRGTSINLGRATLSIGRAADCTVVLEHDFASSRHARLTPGQEGWLLEDLGSTNGTKLNGSPLESPAIVGAGATVQIGKTVLELRR